MNLRESVEGLETACRTKIKTKSYQLEEWLTEGMHETSLCVQDQLRNGKGEETLHVDFGASFLTQKRLK